MSLNRIQKSDPRIKLIPLTQNVGAAKARNVAIKRSQRKLYCVS